MKNIFPFLITFLFFSFSCKQNKNPIKEKKVSVIKSVSYLRDSSYILSSQYIIVNDQKLFLLDNRRSQVIVMDKDFNLLNSIGGRGRGPNEFIDPSSFNIMGKDTLVINDPGNIRLQLYLFNGTHIRSINCKAISARMNRGFLYKNKVLTATSSGEKAIAMYYFNDDFLPTKVTEFGTRYKFENEEQNIIRNDRYLHKYDDRIIAISDNQPFIDVYGINGNILAHYDFSDINIINKQLKYISKNPQHNSKSYRVLIGDTYISKDDLYILTSRNMPEFKRNTIIQFKIKPEVTPVMLYYLPDNVYSSFAVDEKYIYAYGEDKLQKLKLCD